MSGRSAKKRFVVVGTGGRSGMFMTPVAQRFGDVSELVGLCDVNPARTTFHQQRLINEFGYHEVPTYDAADFDRMISEQRPDVVVVCTIDATHHEYIIRGLEAGCDVVTEKPMTTDAEKCRAIYDAVNRTGKNVRVTFNMRYNPGSTKVRELVRDGAVGEVVHVNVEYWLDTSHGADYFRRWHREKDKSGGLLIHKSTHHFDVANWWIDAVPETVFGFGRLAFYGKENAQKRGIEVKYDRYTGHDTTGDPFAYKLDEKGENVRKMYLEAEKHDGYLRDRNVFGEGITAEDTMSVLVRYRTGVTLNYSLNCFCPREGTRVVITGTKGQLEYTRGPREKWGEAANPNDSPHRIMLLPLFGEAQLIPVDAGEGGHDGADPLLQERIFSANPPADPFKRDAGHGQGAASMLIGAAANESFETGLPVNISDLCPQLGDAKKLSELP